MTPLAILSNWPTHIAWFDALLFAASGLTALETIRRKALRPLWQRVLKPGAHLVADAEQVVPLLREMAPHVKEILPRILNEFGNNGGGSLRDAIDRIEAKVAVLPCLQGCPLNDPACPNHPAVDPATVTLSI